jgi:hypothetical protein
LTRSAPRLSQSQYIYRFGRDTRSARFDARQQQGARDVDLALKLNVLAVVTVFAFVSAILLGAF